MSWTTTPNMGFKYHENIANDTTPFDLDQALNDNWEIIDEINPDQRLQALEDAPKNNGVIWQGTYTGTGSHSFEIDYSASTIQYPKMIIINGLTAQNMSQALLLFASQADVFKQFDNDYSANVPFFPPYCTYNFITRKINIIQNSMDSTTSAPQRICNENGKLYCYTMIGET